MNILKHKFNRLFIGLWPAPELRRQISAWQRHLRQQNPQLAAARAVPAENLHLTLHFLGAVERSRLVPLRARLDALRAPRFELQLRGLGYFAAVRVLWLGAERNVALEALVEDIERALAEVLPERPSAAAEYTPHISLFRDAEALAESADQSALRWSVHWPLQDFVLVESIPRPTGPEYRVLQRWPLV